MDYIKRVLDKIEEVTTSTGIDITLNYNSRNKRIEVAIYEDGYRKSVPIVRYVYLDDSVEIYGHTISKNELILLLESYGRF